jgi:transcription antitermination factor NusG
MVFSNDHAGAWFAVQAKTAREPMVAQILKSKGYEIFLPVVKTRPDVAGITLMGERALFPGYLFLRFDPKLSALIVTTPGVIRILGFGRNPVPLDEREIDTLRKVDQADCYREPWPYIKAGAMVRVNAGPLAGVMGRVVSFRNQRRILLTVSLLRRCVAVELEQSWLSNELPFNETRYWSGQPDD